MTTDLRELESMIYSGRGIAVGMTPEGDTFVAYTLTGRSPSSQARKLRIPEEEGVPDAKSNTIITDVTDAKQLMGGDPALLLYPAVVPITENVGEPVLIASNGAQTKLLYSAVILRENTLNNLTPTNIIQSAFSKSAFEYSNRFGWIDITQYEPDAPNYTPRISACTFGGKASLHMVWRDEYMKSYASAIWARDLEPGVAFGIATYKGGNETPLQPYSDDPMDFKISSNNVEDIAESFYKAVFGGQEHGDNYRVATATVLMRKDGTLEEPVTINRIDRGS